jgi:hypothetical protein
VPLAPSEELGSQSPRWKSMTLAESVCPVFCRFLDCPGLTVSVLVMGTKTVSQLNATQSCLLSKSGRSQHGNGMPLA